MELWSQYILPCLCAFAGCIAFTLVFNIHGPGKLIAGFGGALGWLVYLLGGKTILAGFFAAAAISLFSEIMSRLRRCPVCPYSLLGTTPVKLNQPRPSRRTPVRPSRRVQAVTVV